jgi:hypothetical protein
MENADRKVDRLADKYTVRGRWTDNRLKSENTEGQVQVEIAVACKRKGRQAWGL